MGGDAGGARTRKWLAGALLVVAAATILSWRWSKRTHDEAVRPEAASSRASRDSSGTTGATAASPPTRVIRLSGGAEERRQLAQRIAAALRSRRAPGVDSASGRAPETSLGATPPPTLPAGSIAMDTPEHVLTQMQDALKQVKGYVAECMTQAGTKIGGFKAALSLTGDSDIGTLIDASALSSTDGTALPPQLDDCVRGVMQGLELPAMNVGDAFKVNYEFQFDSQPTKEMRP